MRPPAARLCHAMSPVHRTAHRVPRALATFRARRKLRQSAVFAGTTPRAPRHDAPPAVCASPPQPPHHRAPVTLHQSRRQCLHACTHLRHLGRGVEARLRPRIPPVKAPAGSNAVPPHASANLMHLQMTCACITCGLCVRYCRAWLPGSDATRHCGGATC